MVNTIQKLIFVGIALITIVGIVMVSSVPSQNILSEEEILKAGMKSPLLAGANPEEIEIQTDLSLGKPIYVLIYREDKIIPGPPAEYYGGIQYNTSLRIIHRVYLDDKGDIIREMST